MTQGFPDVHHRIPVRASHRYFLRMSKLVLHLAAVLSFAGTLVAPMSALAHGHAHHERSEAQLLRHGGDLAGTGEVEARDEADHPHLTSNPVVTSRLLIGADLTAGSPPDIGAHEPLCTGIAPPIPLDARAPPCRFEPTDSRPRSPPLV